MVGLGRAFAARFHLADLRLYFIPLLFFTPVKNCGVIFVRDLCNTLSKDLEDLRSAEYGKDRAAHIKHNLPSKW